MPIAAADIEYRLSGGASNTDVNASIGGAMSTVGGGLIADATLNNLWDNVSGDEGASGDTEYRCFYIRNNDGSRTVETVRTWFNAQSNSGDVAYAIGLSPAGVDGTAESLADESTAPTGVTFSSPTDKASGLDLGTLTAGQFYAIFVRRVVSAAASAIDNNSYDLRTQVDSPA